MLRQRACILLHPQIFCIGPHHRLDRYTRLVGGAAARIACGLRGGVGRSCLIVFVVAVISRFAVDRTRRNPMHRQIRERTVRSDYESVIAEFIRTKGVTRCPTACVLPTQGSIDPADQAALERHAVAQERLRQAKAAARARLVWNVPSAPPREK
jgi:hypothetical protein